MNSTISAQIENCDREDLKLNAILTEIRFRNDQSISRSHEIGVQEIAGDTDRWSIQKKSRVTPIDGAFRIEMQSLTCLFDTGVLDSITLMHDSVILRRSCIDGLNSGVIFWDDLGEFFPRPRHVLDILRFQIKPNRDPDTVDRLETYFCLAWRFQHQL